MLGSLIWGWFGLSTLIGGAALILALLIPAPLVLLVPQLRHIAISVAIYAFGFSFVYGLGFGKAEGLCESAALRAQIGALQRDLSTAVGSSSTLAEQLKLINDRGAVREQKVADYEEELRKRPVPACGLAAPDLRGVRKRAQ